MKNFLNHLKKIYVKLEQNYYKRILERKQKYYEKLKKRVKVSTPSIIASNCFGTFMYHNLGLQFKSPTINLFFEKEDFFVFLENLQGFLNAELIDFSKEAGKYYPVGMLSYNGKLIKLNFLHYKSFEEAKEKWLERKGRVDFNDLRIVWLEENGITNEEIERFEALPFEHKYVITNYNPWEKDYVYVFKPFNKKNYVSGSIFEYKKQSSKKRLMDCLPYVNWINGEK